MSAAARPWASYSDESLHSNWSAALRGDPARAPRHVKIAFDEFEWGFTYRRA